LPEANWNIISSNTFDANGSFNWTNPADAGDGRFYLLRLQ